MSFISDKLYNGYLRRNMPKIATRVKVREIIVHLSCLTAHDRENIEAKRETYGNHDSMVLLLECLRRRENWPEQFIEALEACEQPTIAAEIRAEYNALKGVKNSNPSSPSASVIKAHVHPAPSASHPENGGNAPAAVALPAEAPAPPQPAALASPPLNTPVQPQPRSSGAQVPAAAPAPEPAPQPPQTEPAPPPSTPPPSPDLSHGPASTPPPQQESETHLEPEENSEPDIQGHSDDNGVSPDGGSKVSANSTVTPPLSRPVEQRETNPVSRPDAVGPTATAEVRLPQSPSPNQANSETSKPSTAQVVRSSSQTERTATTCPQADAAGMEASVLDDNTVCLSKPGQLLSIQPQNQDAPTIPVPQPYSGNSQRLEMSEAVTSAHVPVPPADSGLLCQENGIALDHNEPEENHYESPCQSFLLQVSEEPSILNLDGQVSPRDSQTINGEMARQSTPPAPSSTTTAGTTSSLDTHSGKSYLPSEPAPADMTPEEKTASHTLPTSTKYIMTAAGVGAIALLMAWKFKN